MNSRNRSAKEPSRAAQDQVAELDAWRRAYRRLQATGSSACPQDETLVALALDEAEPDDRRRLADHIVACQDCSERFALLRALHLEASRQDRSSRSASRSSVRRIGTRVAMAAAVVIAAFLATPWFDWGSGSRSSDEVVRGAKVSGAVEPGPDAVLEEPPRRLSWTTTVDGESVHLRLLDATGQLVWETQLEASRAQLPVEVREQLQAGSSYFWVVDPLRRPEGRLGPFWFEVAP